MGKVFCIKCGTENVEEANFCYRCGAKIQKPEEEKQDGSLLEEDRDDLSFEEGEDDFLSEGNEDDFSSGEEFLSEEGSETAEPEQMDEREKMEDEIVDLVLREISLVLEQMVTGDGSASIAEEEQEVFKLIRQKFECLFEEYKSSFEEDEEISKNLKGSKYTSRVYRYGPIDLPVFRPFLSENVEFGCILFSFREVISTTGKIHKDDIQKGLNLCIELLEKLSEAGHGRASYILSQCYGSGVIGVSSEGEPYVVEVDFQKEREYLEKAKGQKNCPMEVYQKLGCQFLRDGSIEQAQKYFKYLSERGIEEGDIYLRYIERLKHKNEAVESYIYFESGNKIKQHLRRNFQEYKGYLYYYVSKTEKTSSGWERSGDKSLFVKENLSDGSKRVLLEITNSGGGACLKRELLFTIHNDLIYYADENGDISSMNLDGENRQVLAVHKGSDWNGYGNGGNYLDMPITVSKHLFFRGGGKSFYEYDRATGQRTKICEAAHVEGISEKEILINNEKTIRILNLDTHEKKSVQQVYPGLKGKKLQNLIYVDMALEIAYYVEDNVSYEKSRIVGIDKEGNIVDIWHMPRIPINLFAEAGMLKYFEKKLSHIMPYGHFPYASLSFTGQKMVLKVQHAALGHMVLRHISEVYGEYKTGKEEGLFQEAFVCEFDRMGNKKIFYKRPYIPNQFEFGAFLAVSGDMVGYLECTPVFTDADKKYWTNEYWTVARSMKTSEGTKLEFFT